MAKPKSKSKIPTSDRVIPTWLAWVCRVVLILGLPVVLVLTNVRLLLTPWFPAVEYSLPGFPADPYGFTKEERLKWANISIEYLLNDADIAFLGNLRFPAGVEAPTESCIYYLDGDCNRLFNDRELRHMLDVKVVTKATLSVWAMTGILVLSALGILYYFRARGVLRAGLLGGAALTALLLVALVIYLTLSFSTFFVQFHEVFFADDTWTFLWSDTLIRLYPVRFWQDAFTFVGGAAILEALALGAGAWWGLKPQQ